MRKRFQNRVAGSWLLLPCMIVYALAVIAVSMCGSFSIEGSVVPVALSAVSVAMMVEMNNANALIRIYSRMVSASFIAFVAMMPSWFGQPRLLIIQACFAICLYMIMDAYHEPSRVGRVFYSFLFIGIATIVYPQSLLMLPVWLLCLFVCILSPSIKQFVAALFGVGYPWLLFSVWAFATDNMPMIEDKIEMITALQPIFQLEEWHLGIVLPILIVNIVTIIGSLHFFFNSYADKVRTRQIFEFFIMMYFFFVVAMVLQPSQAETLFALQLCVAAPIAGHFVALSSSRLSNLTFVVLLLLIVAVTGYNLWMLY